MDNHKAKKAQEIKCEIDEAVYFISKVTGHLTSTIDAEMSESIGETGDLEAKLEQAKKSQVERRTTVEAEHERTKRGLYRKWKRY